MESRRTERFEAFKLFRPRSEALLQRPARVTSDLRRVGARVKDWNLAVWAGTVPDTSGASAFFILLLSL